MTTFPGTIIGDELKITRGDSNLSSEEISARIMVKLAREGWKHFPSSLPDEILGQAGISRKQYLALYTAVKDG